MRQTLSKEVPNTFDKHLFSMKHFIDHTKKHVSVFAMTYLENLSDRLN